MTLTTSPSHHVGPNPTGSISTTMATPLFTDAVHALRDLRQMPFTERVTSDEHGLLMAFGGSLRADCRRRQVCAIVTDAHGRVIGAGYNGAPPGRPGCLSDGACPRGQMSLQQVAPGSSYTSGLGVCGSLHAEKNGLLYSDPVARRGGTMFITDAPCDPCSLDLAGSGLAYAVWPVFQEDGSMLVCRHDLTGPIGGHYA
jgi:dCMP deaminase